MDRLILSMFLMRKHNQSQHQYTNIKEKKLKYTFNNINKNNNGPKNDNLVIYNPFE